jgi:tetratricopeptide (TPR) repeat protein
MNRCRLVVVCLAGLVPGLAAAGPAPATVKEYDRVFTTYPFGDPDPIASGSKIYPYFRLDGFTDQPVPKSWKVVELANEHLQVLILPEIGGKVWAAVEKSTGRSFLYFNHVVKFRDVAMRGPWTSGGIETNYGIMGHAPSCSAPVDYVARQNPDGSASCWIGGLDLLTRTTWRLEIRLPAGAAGFETRSLWHNGTAAEQPYYTWENVGIKSAGNLRFVNPGSHFIGHDGKAAPWPVNPENGHDASDYERNDFGGPKSYHVLGRYSDFFGGYWLDDDFGMAHVAAYRDKPGRKVWIWGLSREGMIWEPLLTDHDGQYVEVQSGRLFNQAAESSAHTPFQQRAFPPFATDVWTEHWLPVKGIKGFVTASAWGAMNVSRAAGKLVVRVSPSRALRDNLDVLDGDRLLARREVSLEPMRPLEETFTLAAPPRALRVAVGHDKLCYEEGDGDLLTRPLESPPGFDWSAPQGLYLRGRDRVKLRAYTEAERLFEACLKRDPNDVRALTELAALANRRGDFSEAYDRARRALAVDTYEPAANFQFGLASAAKGKTADARAAFSIAALSPAWRSAAGCELARVFLRAGRFEAARAAAGEALDADRRNLDALQLQACAARLQGDATAADAATAALLALDPLCHFARVEQYLHGRSSRASVTGLVRNELPHETYLELAAWYRGVGRDDDAARVLELAPPTAEVLYWLAYLRHDARLLARADAASPLLAFPFRAEALPVFEWACGQTRAWPSRYFLALVRWNLGNWAKARELLASCGDEPSFGPFYAARAHLVVETAERDLQRADRLDPGQWRYGALLAKLHLQHGETAKALSVAADSTRRFPAVPALTLLHARTLLASSRFQDAIDVLAPLHLLPAEGTTEARFQYREALLMRAVERLKAGDFDQALGLVERARDWPERLGSGKPYPADIDERLEDWLAGQCQLGRKAPAAAHPAFERIMSYQSGGRSRGVGEVVRALALKQLGRGGEAARLVAGWRADDPGNDLARWADALVAGRPAPPPAGRRDTDSRVLAAWAAAAKTP